MDNAGKLSTSIRSLLAGGVAFMRGIKTESWTSWSRDTTTMRIVAAPEHTESQTCRVIPLLVGRGTIIRLEIERTVPLEVVHNALGRIGAVATEEDIKVLARIKTVATEKEAVALARAHSEQKLTKTHR